MQHPSKRRATRSPSPQLPAHYLTTSAQASDSSSLVVQAHEATLVSGSDTLARETETRQTQGGRMARWSGSGNGEEEEVWIDRYDILNLLPALPAHLPFPSSTIVPLPSSSTPRATVEDERGPSDLASDHEEEFYFRQLPPEEREELEKKRKRRRLERGREERLRLLEEQEAREREAKGLALDEEEETEPSETQLSMMRKLHSTLSAAQNPSLLEMRILTNHSNDPKFQFLKKGGKWRDIWERIRRGEKVEFGNKEETSKSGGGLAGLGGYGSSDSEGENEKEDDIEAREVHEETGHQVADEVMVKGDAALDVEAIPEEGNEEEGEERRRKEAKAEKVREWARKRKEAREMGMDGS
ncbi:uncharacterized protein JCM6883_006955 [Sporobolomyces salmoneus]|uniref:uncharacterized protein n=1 Tax=Sporobolomyces salmoneus TaxID=183962 RepID=UPI00317E4AD7